jgi:hypothetical protein
LTAFLGGVLTKKYTNPSSDVIEILAGLDQVDRRVSDLVKVIDDLVRKGGSSKFGEVGIGAVLILISSSPKEGN